MFDIEKWQEIIKTLQKHKVRTLLTAFGVFWGIFMLSVLLGVGKGLENAVIEGFPKVKNVVYVWSKNTTQIPYAGLPTGRRIVFQQNDVDAIQRNVASVGLVKGQNSVGIWGGFPPSVVNQENGKNGTFYVEGTHAGFKDLNSMKLIEGRQLNELDDKYERKVAIIGKRVKEQLFISSEPAVGKTLIVNNISFLVIGVFDSTFKGNKQQEEEKLYIPNTTLRKAFNQMDYVGSLVVLPAGGYSAIETERDVKNYLAKIKRFSPEDDEVIGSFNMQEEFEKVNGLFIGIAAFSWLVAVGTILAGAIGVGNIMLIVVKERTREIGLRKALGATRFSIISMIMHESIFITAVSGYMGLACGVFLVEGIGRVIPPDGAILNPEVNLQTAIVALIVLIIAGILASLLPATKAANVNPIVALQDE